VFKICGGGCIFRFIGGTALNPVGGGIFIGGGGIIPIKGGGIGGGLEIFCSSFWPPF